jgi:hypothetical protein
MPPTTNNYAYQGAQDQGTSGTDYNSIQFLIHQELAKISTASVVKIVKGPYDKDGKAIEPGAPGAIGYVDVQPMVNQLDGYGNATPHGTVYRLSYHRSQGGSNAVINDPVVGDIGKMVVGDRDSSVVRATNKVGNPGSKRKFDKADGTYIGNTQGQTPDQWIAFTKDGIVIHDKNGNSIVMSPDGIAIKSTNGNVTVNAVKIDLNP